MQMVPCKPIVPLLHCKKRLLCGNPVIILKLFKCCSKSTPTGIYAFVVGYSFVVELPMIGAKCYSLYIRRVLIGMFRIGSYLQAS